MCRKYPFIKIIELVFHFIGVNKLQLPHRCTKFCLKRRGFFEGRGRLGRWWFEVFWLFLFVSAHCKLHKCTVTFWDREHLCQSFQCSSGSAGLFFKVSSLLFLHSLLHLTREVERFFFVKDLALARILQIWVYFAGADFS